MTHAFVGAAIAKAGAERATPLATATLVVAASAPDVDMLSYVGGPYYALAFRRGITHGWPALLVLPFLVAGVMLAWDRWVRRRRRPEAAPARAGPTLALAAVGLATHPTLDWMNTYGMRWSLPFDGGWSYADALFIIDPWIWLALGGTLFLTSSPGRTGRTAWTALAVLSTLLVLVGMPAAALSWLVGLGLIVWLHRRSLPATAAGRRRLAGSVLAGVALYAATLTALDQIAAADVRRAAETAGLVSAGGLAPGDVLVSPQRGRLFRSAVEVRTDDGYVPGTHHWLASPRVELRPGDRVPLVSGPASVPAEVLEDVVARAREVPDARNYLVWSRYPYVRVDSADDAWRVRFADARYDDEPGAASLQGVDVTVPRAGTR